MVTIFADGVACVTLLLIIKALLHSKHKRTQTKKGNQLREKEGFQYIPVVKIISNDNKLASGDTIRM